MSRIIRRWTAVLAACAAVIGSTACGERMPEAPGEIAMTTGDVQAAALATYVKPGDLDEYYLFYSGGHSGQVFVAGVPSMRNIVTIPVFTPYPATGYGFDEETKAMLGGFTWGDVHHPALSKTNGDYDGRWLCVNDNANNRIARIDLRDFKTKQILGPIPNTSGNHGSSMVTSNTEYALVASRFSVPLPKGRYVPLDEYATKYKGAVTGIRIDPDDGTMSLGWQIITPPFNWDLGATGKGPSEGWAFWTSYNTERATKIAIQKTGLKALTTFMENIEESGHPVAITQFDMTKRIEPDSYTVNMTIAAWDRSEAPAATTPAPGSSK